MGLVTILFSSSKARRCEIKKVSASRQAASGLADHTQSLGCNFLPFRIVKERLAATPIGAPFQARALTPVTPRKSLERLRLVSGREYHRAHPMIRQRGRVDFAPPACKPSVAKGGVHDGWR